MCTTEHMSYIPYQNLQTYRLPNATFPLSFTMHGETWRLETFTSRAARNGVVI